MGLVESIRDSGLILVEREDGAAVARALQAHDPRLSLRVDQQGLWRVYFNDQGRDVFILAWQDELGNPLPLSSGLVEAVQARDRAGRSEPLDADALNARFQAEVEKQKQRDLEAIESEHLPAIKTNRLAAPIKEKPW